MKVVKYTAPQLEELLRETVAKNRGRERETRSQKLFDELVEACLEEKELVLGNAVAMLHGMRVMGRQGPALSVLIALSLELKMLGQLDVAETRLELQEAAEEAFGRAGPETQVAGAPRE